MSETISDYYTRRAKEARAMAAKASDMAARQVHEALADQYEKMADGKLVQGIVDR
jgi:hypothetical protein